VADHDALHGLQAQLNALVEPGARSRGH
jgi:hypothetical protein